MAISIDGNYGETSVEPKETIQERISSVETLSESVEGIEGIAFSHLNVNLIDPLSLTPEEYQQLSIELITTIPSIEDTIVLIYSTPKEERLKLIPEPSPIMGRFLASIPNYSADNPPPIDVHNYLTKKKELADAELEVIPDLRDLSAEMYSQFYDRFDFPRFFESLNNPANISTRTLFFNIVRDFDGIGDRILHPDSEQTSSFSNWIYIYNYLNELLSQNEQWLLPRPANQGESGSEDQNGVLIRASRIKTSALYYDEAERYGLTHSLVGVTEQRKVPYAIDYLARDHDSIFLHPRAINAFSNYLTETQLNLFGDKEIIENTFTNEELDLAAETIFKGTVYTYLLGTTIDDLPAFIRYRSVTPFSHGQIPDYYRKLYPKVIIDFARLIVEAYEKRGIDIKSIPFHEPSITELQETEQYSQNFPEHIAMHIRFSRRAAPDLKSAYAFFIVAKEHPELFTDIQRYTIIVNFQNLINAEKNAVPQKSETHRHSVTWIKDRRITIGDNAMQIQSTIPDMLPISKIEDFLKEQVLSNGLPTLFGITAIEIIPISDETGTILPPKIVDPIFLEITKTRLFNETRRNLLHEIFEHAVANFDTEDMQAWHQVVQRAQTEPGDIPYITDYPRMIEINGDKLLAYKEDFCETAALFFESQDSLYRLHTVSPLRFAFMMDFVEARLAEKHRPIFRKNILEEIENLQKAYDLQEEIWASVLNQPKADARRRIKKIANEHMEIPREKYLRTNSDALTFITQASYRYNEEQKSGVYTGNILLRIPQFILEK